VEAELAEGGRGGGVSDCTVVLQPAATFLYSVLRLKKWREKAHEYANYYTYKHVMFPDCLGNFGPFEITRFNG
jgi:hypothetical protein